MVVTRRKIIGCKCCVGSDPTSEFEDQNLQNNSTENEVQISPTDTMAKKETEILVASICE